MEIPLMLPGCFFGFVLTIAASCAGAQVASNPSKGEPRQTPRSVSQFDPTGYWASVVTEDWRDRMLAPRFGQLGSIPASKKGIKVASQWNPQRDAAGGDACKAYGPPGLMRMPGRVHISWHDDETLRLDFDAGKQARALHFAKNLPGFGYSSALPPIQLIRAGAPDPVVDRQGYSVAAWSKQRQGRGFSGFAGQTLQPPEPGQGGSLFVMTTNMAEGYLQKNGVPYGKGAVLTEFFNLITLPHGEDWLIVTATVEDAEYLSGPYVTSTHFRREPDGAKWTPADCGVL